MCLDHSIPKHAKNHKTVRNRVFNAFFGLLYIAMLISIYCVTSRQHRLTINTSASQEYIYSVARHSPSVV